MIYIGLDLATHKTGCCIMDSGGNLIHYELIVANEDETDFRKRIVEIGKKVEGVIVKYRPETMVVEDAPLITKNSNTSTSLLLIMHGYFMCLSENNKLEFISHNPSHWRTVLGLPMRGEDKKMLKKEQLKVNTVNFVNAIYNTNFMYKKDSPKSTDDIADSIGVVLCAVKEGEQ